MIVVLDATAIIALLDRTTGVDEHVRVATGVVAPDLAVAEILKCPAKVATREVRSAVA